MDGGTLAQYVVEYYMYYFQEYGQGEAVYGLSAVDLGQSSAMMSAVKAFTQAVDANPAGAR